MKGKTKKLIALSLATTMTGSLVAIAACGCDSDDTDSGTPGTGSTTQSTILLNSMLSQDFNAIAGNVDVKINGSAKVYANDNGTKGKLLQEGTETIGMSETGKFNLKSGDADITVKSTNNDKTSSHEYMFLRNWHAFDYDALDNGMVTNWGSNVTLNYSGNPFDSLTEEGSPTWSQYLPTVFGEMVSELTNTTTKTYTYSIAKIADSFNGLTIDSKQKTATIDLNATVYGAVTAIGEVLSSINDNTTIGDILKTDAVKNILMSVTELFPATEIKSAFDEVLQSLPVEIKQMIDSMGIDLSKIFIAPDKNSTTYDYLVKIISSEELKNAINKIIQFAMQQQGVTGGIGFGLTDTLDKMKVAPLFQMAGISVTDIARSFKDYTKQITKDSFVINLPDENGESDNLSPSPYDAARETTSTVTITGANIVYTLSDDNKVSKQDISATCAHTFTEVYNEEIEDYNMTYVIKGTLEYSATDYTLADISNCKTAKYAKQYTDNAKIYLNNQLDYTLTQNVKDNKIESFILKNETSSQTIYVDNPFMLTIENEQILCTLDVSEYSVSIVSVDHGFELGYASLEFKNGFLQSTVKDVLAGKPATFIPVSDYN